MKKTKATIAAEEKEKAALALRAALRWSDDSDIEPDVPPPTASFDLTTGWTFNAYSRRVMVACSSSFAHGIGRTDQTNSQRPLSLYSTRGRALRALRVALEKEFAVELAKIDAEIEKERVKQ